MKINGDYCSRFCHAGETGVCAGAETAQMAESGVAGTGLAVRGSALLFRRMALVELAVLVVIIVSRGA